MSHQYPEHAVINADLSHPGDDYNRRRNSESEHKHLQYHTPRGNIPSSIIAHELHRGPPPVSAPQPASFSGYPHVYRNDEEGRDDIAPYNNFDDWERHPSDKDLFEYPACSPDPSGFSYDAAPTAMAKLKRPGVAKPKEDKIWLKGRLLSFETRKPEEEDKKVYPADVEPPKTILKPTKQYAKPNDVGYIRAVSTTQQRDVVGVIYHPTRSTMAFERATLEPLDRNGRSDLHRFEDGAKRSRKQTWPPRTNDSRWD